MGIPIIRTSLVPGHIPRTFPPPGQLRLSPYMVYDSFPLLSLLSADLQYKAIYRQPAQN